MKRQTICELLASDVPLSDVFVCGWVRTRRDAKGFTFLELNDGSCLSNIQCILDESSAAFASLPGVNTGACVRIEGDLVASLGKGQAFEVRAREMQVYGLADSETYPLQKKRHSDEFLRSIAHLRPRTNKYGAMLRVRAEASQAVHDFFYNEGYYYVHTPIITGADCEGAGELFRVSTLPHAAPLSAEGEPFCEDFFGKEAKLTVSGQLEAEALALALGKVYTFGPTFRAENSNTPRHAAEFWMIEPEEAFANLADMMDLAERFVRSVVVRVLERREDDIALFNKFVDTSLLETLRNLIDNPFAHVSYREAMKILESSGEKFEFPIGFGRDLQTEHERFLAETYFKKPVIVHDYPKDIKAFYMRLNDDGETVAAMDLLVPRIGELIGGSQREERFDFLEKRIVEMGQNVEDFWWYMDLRRFGTVPHAGFGLGFARLLMMLTGISNIRDVIPFPRTPGNLEF